MAKNCPNESVPSPSSFRKEERYFMVVDEAEHKINITYIISSWGGKNTLNMINMYIYIYWNKFIYSLSINPLISWEHLSCQTSETNQPKHHPMNHLPNLPGKSSKKIWYLLSKTALPSQRAIKISPQKNLQLIIILNFSTLNCTSPKFNMEPENAPWKKRCLFGNPLFRVPC